MQRYLGLPALCVAFLIVFAVVFWWSLPLKTALGVAGLQTQAVGVSGTPYNGSVQALSIGGIQFENIETRFDRVPILYGSIKGNMQAQTTDGMRLSGQLDGLGVQSAMFAAAEILHPGVQGLIAGMPDVPFELILNDTEFDYSKGCMAGAASLRADVTGVVKSIAPQLASDHLILSGQGICDEGILDFALKLPDSNLVTVELGIEATKIASVGVLITLPKVLQNNAAMNNRLESFGFLKNNNVWTLTIGNRD